MQIYDGRKSFYQWDLNQKITSPNFKVGDEIHFTSLQQSTALIVLAYELDGKVVADVPNILLQNSYPITAYQYITVTDMDYTIDEQLFTVIKRPQPDDYVYTETEIYSIKTAVEKALLEAKESGEFDGEDGKDGADGKDAITDQTYSSTSENAQSGKAVKEAIKTEVGEIDKLGNYGVVIKDGYLSVSPASTADIEGRHPKKPITPGLFDYALMKSVDQIYNSNSPMPQSGKAVAEAVKITIGDIDTALDNIIAIQNSLIGGGSE